MITTEKESHYSNIDEMSLHEILININKEDKTIANAVEKVIPQIEKLAELIIEKINLGGRLFYIGSGTSGRLGIIDAAECPPTFGVEDTVIGLIAGGEHA
ncbi:MAG: N-acetylmuramic acid 6-phosphate etherase, partial [Bacteroidetes bacterium]|nr:N-acetylmuramic acid 6-phosphate etherase [Bacteroidota bacterium]